jgi:predicted Fe-Mo cluster-binding NifX family protein
MKAAISAWRGRVSPVFDVAKHLIVADCVDGKVAGREEVVLDEAGLATRAKRVADLGAEVLICGAISRPLEAALAGAGVGVVAQTCGPVEEVLEAFASGRLTESTYLMPGCCGRRRRLRGRRHRRGPGATDQGEQR